MVHPFPHAVSECELPAKFTFPFCYTPHPLCVEAARLVQEEIASLDTAWQEELAQGKMFGVLLVRNPECPDAPIGFLAAFSGNVCGTNRHPYFVPPVYDLLDPDGFFKPEEARISSINCRIGSILNGEEYQQSLKDREFVETQGKKELDAFREEMRRKKELRTKRRSELLAHHDPAEVAGQLAELTKESQFMKAELKRKEHSLASCLNYHDVVLLRWKEEMEELREERKRRSAILQNRIFEKYVLLNARGERKNILQIFSEYSDRTAPAGTGECAAPKLLQYAYLHGLEPLAMAEFWWGRSPVSEIRHQGHFYPSCHSKCEPLLKFMMEGLEVEANPLANSSCRKTLEVVYEDQWYLAVNKPAGLLSAPGKPVIGREEPEESVWSILHREHPEFTGPLILHRLDMATSGLLLVAKSQEAYVRMQHLFETRQVRKRYEAILDGMLADNLCGRIELPLCPDINDRPRQMVSREVGKEAITDYQVLSAENGYSRIAFWPVTGRTHQLRVHSAHPLGLNTPILGDSLYGSPVPSDGKHLKRLHLHAESLDFIHPFTGKSVHIHSKPEF